MVEPGRRLGLVLKTLRGVGACRLLGRKHLQRHGSAQLGVDGAKDAAHPAAAHVFDQIEVPDPVARHHPAFKDSGSRVRGGRRGNRRRTGDDRRLSASGLPVFAPADDEPSARTDSVLARRRRQVRAFGRVEAESFISCYRETDAAIRPRFKGRPGPSTATRPCSTNHPTPGTNARQEKFFTSQNLHFSRWAARRSIRLFHRLRSHPLSGRLRRLSTRLRYNRAGDAIGKGA